MTDNDNTSQTNISIGDATFIRKTRRVRQMTDAEFYRAISQLYDEVEENASKKTLSTWGWSFISTGATHFLASVTSEIPGNPLFTGSQMQLGYRIVSGLFFIAGLFMVGFSKAFPKNRCKTKEMLLKKYIDQELNND